VKTAREFKTVRDFKNFVLRVSHVRDYLDFCRLSDTHEAFWLKLNGLGTRNVTANADGPMPHDIDATSTLTEREEKELLTEFHLLKRSNSEPVPSIRTKALASRKS
jgi:CRISPR/Cas system-associated endonuclease Cas3-HD